MPGMYLDLIELNVYLEAMKHTLRDIGPAAQDIKRE